MTVDVVVVFRHVDAAVTMLVLERFDCLRTRKCGILYALCYLLFRLRC